MDTPMSAAPDEITPPPELALAIQLGKEKSSPSGPPEISAAVARLTSNSIDELHKLVSEIDSAVAGINIIVETIGPWKSIAGSSGTRNVRAAGPAANIEQRIRGG